MTDANVISSDNPISGKPGVSIEADEEILGEIGFAILGRAQDIHENPDDDHEDVAETLRDIGQEILGNYVGVDHFE